MISSHSLAPTSNAGKLAESDLGAVRMESRFLTLQFGHQTLQTLINRIGRLLARKQSLALLLSLKNLEVNGVWNPVTIISDDQSIDGKVDNGIISLSPAIILRLSA